MTQGAIISDKWATFQTTFFGNHNRLTVLTSMEKQELLMQTLRSRRKQLLISKVRRYQRLQTQSQLEKV